MCYGAFKINATGCLIEYLIDDRSIKICPRYKTSHETDYDVAIFDLKYPVSSVEIDYKLTTVQSGNRRHMAKEIGDIASYG